ncbi:hypothetical protein Gotur_016249 [Gossypium turneri]
MARPLFKQTGWKDSKRTGQIRISFLVKRFRKSTSWSDSSRQIVQHIWKRFI